MKITLSPEELAYLHRSSFLSDRMRIRLMPAIDQETRKSVVNLSCEEADILRDLLATRLQQIGFDQNYSLTLEGEMLEDLMDKLSSGQP